MLKRFLNKLQLKRLLNNWPLKLLSVLVGALVWLVIISLADPTDTKTIYNIPVTIQNEDLLTKSGKSYSVEGGDNPVVNIRVTASSSVTRELKVSDFTATADIKEMVDINGAVPIRVTCSNSAVSDSQIELVNSAVTIRYEDIMSKNFIISIQSEETPPEGYFVGSMSANPRTVRVTAPSSVLNRIGRVVAEVDVSQLTESTQIESALRYFTNSDEELHLDTYKDTRASTSSIMVGVEIQTMKTVPVMISQEAVDELKAQVPEDYRYTGHSTLPTIQVKGLKSRLADLTAVTITPGSLSLKDATEDKVFELDLNYFLPEGIELMDGQESLFIVTLFVDKLVVREFTVRSLRLIGEEDGYRYEYDPEIPVSIRGLEDDFAGFDESMISLTMDVTDYANNPGKYVLQVDVHCEDEEIFTPLPGPRIEVTIKAEAPPTRSRETTVPPTTAPTVPAETTAADSTLPSLP